MSWELIWVWITTIGGWIGLLILENAPGFQGKFFAALYKYLFAKAIIYLYSPESEDTYLVSEQLFNSTRDFNEKFHQVYGETIGVEAYRWILVVICVNVFSIHLGITYLVIRWDKIAAESKRVLDEGQYKRWVRNHWIEIGTNHFVKYILLPSIWPYFCSFIGTEAKHISSVWFFGLLNYSYLAFVFRFNYEEDLGVTDTIVAITGSIVYNCIGKQCGLPLYKVLIITSFPLLTRSGLVHVLKLTWPED